MDISEKFQNFLLRLFHFDLADLDFGIYRVLNYKRQQIEAFITNSLPRIIDDAFANYAAAEGIKRGVYENLYTFFTRYYGGDDFVLKPRRGGSEKYVIPYDGSEVSLYWATKGQHYVANPTSNGKQSLLFKHLTTFTRRNMTDFFIHRNLRRFLEQELDAFIKSEMLSLDELLNGIEVNLQRRILQAKVVKNIASMVIEFLAQVEDFQNHMFEKGKMVIRADYCLTINYVPETLWDDVLRNETQMGEWEKLYGLGNLLEKDGVLNQGLNKDFLCRHPTLIVDTRYFSDDFKWSLLSNFEDLDEVIDGVLIKSENYQALKLLLEKYRKQIKCVYIDPPYNTGNGDFLYKDNYRHSSWMSMMAERLDLTGNLIREDGGLFISVDYNEDARLRLLLEDTLGTYQYRNTIVTARVKKNIMEREKVKSLNWGHSYLMFFAASDKTVITPPVRAVAQKRKENWHALDAPGIRPTMEYELFGKKPPQGRHWMFSRDNATKMVDAGELRLNPNSGCVEYRVPNAKGILLGTNWTDQIESDSGWGFTTPKNVSFIKRIINMVAGPKDYILDFFAGSGTTGEAVIRLNNEDNGQRKYILVEMGDYFETILMPRIKQTICGHNGNSSKQAPSRGRGHMFKYLYIEQYEDVLNNIELSRQQNGQQLLNLPHKDYLLRYSLQSETLDSQILLNIECFRSPFTYKLKIHESEQIVEQPVDLVETFNYLLGLHVRRILPFTSGGRDYRTVLGTKDGKDLVVIWRSVISLEEDAEALQLDKAFIEHTILPALLKGQPASRILVNGNCLVENAEPIEQDFKQRMFAVR